MTRHTIGNKVLAAFAAVLMVLLVGACGAVDSDEGDIIDVGEAEQAVCQSRDGVQSSPDFSVITNCNTSACVDNVGDWVRHQAALRCVHMGSATANRNCPSECDAWLAGANAKIDQYCKTMVPDPPNPPYTYHWTECNLTKDEEHACRAQCMKYTFLQPGEDPVDGGWDTMEPQHTDCHEACNALFPH